MDWHLHFVATCLKSNGNIDDVHSNSHLCDIVSGYPNTKCRRQ